MLASPVFDRFLNRETCKKGFFPTTQPGFGVGHAALRVGQFGGVGARVVAIEFGLHVLEEVLLAPALEHALGNHLERQVLACCEDPGLMAVRRSATDFAHPEGGALAGSGNNLY